MGKLHPLFLTTEGLGLATDLYELTMAAGYFENGKRERAVFELFVRALPKGRSYLVAAGLEQALHYLTHLRFSRRAISYLRRHPAFARVGDAFFDYLAEFRFSGDVWALPEGTVFFPGEPALAVQAPLIEAQIVETFLLSTVNYQTLVATKAARTTQAARGRPVVDFGSRRAHGFGAGMYAARASFIGGCAGTSNVLAARELGLPAVGTAAHSWTMAFESETDAFEAYQRVFPDSATLLIDTYDPLEGARRAARLKDRIQAVRIDSGDLAEVSRKVRRILDRAGARNVRIIASGDLNEYKIDALLRAGAPIDAFGVGTEMVTSRDDPALSGVYKLVEIEREGAMVPLVKLSEEKATYPCRKQVFRRSDARGRFAGDTVARADADLPGEPLLEQVMKDGRLLASPPALKEIQARAAESLARLPARYKRLRGAARYPVAMSKGLEAARAAARRAAGD